MTETNPSKHNTKGLRLYLPPFAPDTSGAVSVFYGLGGLTIIVDAGGCAGNICGFDGPDLLGLEHPELIVSAGLRDMDAIMGRDDKLILKLTKAVQQARPSFVAIIGSPVPSVIGTDFQALEKIAEKATELPVITVEADGIRSYDEGVARAYYALVKKFVKLLPGAKERIPRPHKLGVLGVTQMDFTIDERKSLNESLLSHGWKTVVMPGLDTGRVSIQELISCERIMVPAPAGLAAAKYLEKKYGLPYFTGYPMGINHDLLRDVQLLLVPTTPLKILIVQQQYAANALRTFLQGQLPNATIVCGTFFHTDPGGSVQGDQRFHEEAEFRRYVMDGEFNAIVGDKLLKRALPEYDGFWVDYPHFAISGKK